LYVGALYVSPLYTLERDPKMKARSWIGSIGFLTLGVAACADLALAPTTTHRVASARFDAQPSPQILACPSAQTQQTTGVIGLLGGAITLGGMKVEIPFGAVLNPTLFQIVVPASQYMEVDVHAVGLTSF